MKKLLLTLIAVPVIVTAQGRPPKVLCPEAVPGTVCAVADTDEQRELKLIFNGLVVELETVLGLQRDYNNENTNKYNQDLDAQIAVLVDVRDSLTDAELKASVQRDIDTLEAEKAEYNRTAELDEPETDRDKADNAGATIFVLNQQLNEVQQVLNSL